MPLRQLFMLLFPAAFDEVDLPCIRKSTVSPHRLMQVVPLGWATRLTLSRRKDAVNCDGGFPTMKRPCASAPESTHSTKTQPHPDACPHLQACCCISLQKPDAELHQHLEILQCTAGHPPPYPFLLHHDRYWTCWQE